MRGRGCWGRRGYALEGVAARICREAGGRVRTNMFVRGHGFGCSVNHGGRLEVVVDGLPLHGGAQLAVDNHYDEEQRARMGSRCGRQTPEGRHVSGAGRPSLSSQVGGLGSGGRRKMVG